jgi:hypothetical protein
MRRSPQMMIRSCRDVTIHGFKFERPGELLNIIGSSDVTIIGGSGNYSIESPDDRGIIVIENSSGILLANLNRKPQRGGIPSSWIVDGEDRVTDEYAIVLYMRE